MAPHRPTEPVWFLCSLGVDPDRQGSGLGRAVIRPGLEAADSAGLSSFLETSDKRNVRFYRNFGFEVSAEYSLPGGGPEPGPWHADPERELLGQRRRLAPVARRKGVYEGLEDGRIALTGDVGRATEVRVHEKAPRALCAAGGLSSVHSALLRGTEDTNAFGLVRDTGFEPVTSTVSR
ncbi:GNAT family N-acetyltransferase [Nocardiopsis gilva]|uniref:GNAT family N-acetyltransferase n=1 Tax=Nocardiopsis gilva TaxID=280236 RepID=UPI002FC7D011